MKLPWRKQDWDTITFRRSRWPEGIYSWTYRRSSHPIVWAAFGNDRDGCTPWVNEKQWTWGRWWLRNRWSNWGEYILGLVSWSPDHIPNEFTDHSHLETRSWIGTNEDDPMWLAWIKIKPGINMGFRILPHWWHPYIHVHLPFKMFFHIGWKPTRGHFTAAIKSQ